MQVLPARRNPAIDSQSVDRAYRIGQAKDVIVYRHTPNPSVLLSLAHRYICAPSHDGQVWQWGRPCACHQALPEDMMRSFRLITCGTVEEKIFRKQVFKGGLARTGTREGIQTAYFSSQVRGNPARVSLTWLLLQGHNLAVLPVLSGAFTAPCAGPSFA